MSFRERERDSKLFERNRNVFDEKQEGIYVIKKIGINYVIVSLFYVGGSKKLYI